MLISKTCRLAISTALLSMLALGANRSWSTTTMCSNAQAKRYHYGDKQTLTFAMPSDNLNSITEQVQTFAAKNKLSYSSVGGHDPYTTPQLETLEHILQSKGFDVAIMIRATNRSNVATARIYTFSLSCGSVREDWRPYWRAFKSFLVEQKYPVLDPTVD